MDKTLLEALDKYFTTLSITGYMSYEDVSKLIFMILSDEFFNDDFKEFMEEEDWNTLYGIYDCIYGSSCLFPYPGKC